MRNLIIFIVVFAVAYWGFTQCGNDGETATENTETVQTEESTSETDGSESQAEESTATETPFEALIDEASALIETCDYEAAYNKCNEIFAYAESMSLEDCLELADAYIELYSRNNNNEMERGCRKNVCVLVNKATEIDKIKTRQIIESCDYLYLRTQTLRDFNEHNGINFTDDLFHY